MYQFQQQSNLQCSTFNSLYEILYCYIRHLPTVNILLSILFMRFDKIIGVSAPSKSPTFNSLYEILCDIKGSLLSSKLSILFMRFGADDLAATAIGAGIFQFSLWDSEISPDGVNYFVVWLSILFMRFYKFFYASFSPKNLSILFMRFVTPCGTDHFRSSSPFNSLYEIPFFIKLFEYNESSFNSLYEILTTYPTKTAKT